MKRNIQIALVLIVILVFVSVLSLKENPFQGGEKELVCTAPVTKKVLNSEWIQPDPSSTYMTSLREQQENFNYCKNSTIAFQYAFRFDTDLMDKQDSIRVQTSAVNNCISKYNFLGYELGKPDVRSEQLKATSQYLVFYGGIGVPYFTVDRKTLEVVKSDSKTYEFSCAVKHVAKQRNKI